MFEPWSLTLLMSHWHVEQILSVSIHWVITHGMWLGNRNKALCSKSNRDFQLQLWLDHPLYSISLALEVAPRPPTKHLRPSWPGSTTTVTYGQDPPAEELHECSKTHNQNVLPSIRTLPLCLFPKSSLVHDEVGINALQANFKEEFYTFQAYFRVYFQVLAFLSSPFLFSKFYKPVSKLWAWGNAMKGTLYSASARAR